MKCFNTIRENSKNPFDNGHVNFLAEVAPQMGGSAEATRKPTPPKMPRPTQPPSSVTIRTQRVAEGESLKKVRKELEDINKPPIDVMVVCGMGPLSLDAGLRMQTEGKTKRLFPNQPYMRINANSAKLLAAHHGAENVIVSGRRTANVPEKGRTSLQERERQASEADLLADTYDRMGGKGVTREGRERAAKVLELDQNAATTFDNIIQGLNMMDRQNGGYWDGSFAVLSPVFHGPRIDEMLVAFGLKNARFMAAERVLRHFGYEGRLYPTRDFGFGKPYEEFEEDVYRSQPAGLQNLQDNPAYLTFELAKVESNRRLQEMAQGVKSYYNDKGIELPEIYESIPQGYNPDFDFSQLREGFAAIPFSKHPYKGELASTQPYREMASQIASKTTEFLNEAMPIAP